MIDLTKILPSIPPGKTAPLWDEAAMTDAYEQGAEFVLRMMASHFGLEVEEEEMEILDYDAWAKATMIEILKEAPGAADYKQAMDSHMKHVRDLDYAMNGDGAAWRPFLIDIKAQLLQRIFTYHALERDDAWQMIDQTVQATHGSWTFHRHGGSNISPPTFQWAHKDTGETSPPYNSEAEANVWMAAKIGKHIAKAFLDAGNITSVVYADFEAQAEQAERKDVIDAHPEAWEEAMKAFDERQTGNRRGSYFGLSAGIRAFCAKVGLR